MCPQPALATEGVTVPCLTTLDADRIREHLASGRFFWIDLTDPSAAEVHQLGEIFGFHPLALEDTAHFGQRPKLDYYGDYGFLVSYGADELAHDDVDLLREVHLTARSATCRRPGRRAFGGRWARRAPTAATSSRPRA